MASLMKRSLQQLCKTIRCFSTVSEISPHVCVVGSGPAGFYTSMKLLKLGDNVKVDMYEKLPVPFGLVRYGVAPDHPEIKAVIKQFGKVTENHRFRFIGNVEVGKDVTIKALREAYNVVVLAYGASSDRELEIKGEEHVISGQKVVGWYNGTEKDVDFKFNLDAEEVIVIGLGNVALDICRILLMNIDDLRKTDITEHALAVLSKSRVKKVHMVGRRGPLQAAFTIAELREMIDLPGCGPIVHSQDFSEIKPMVPDLPRPKKRMMQLLIDTATEPPKKEDAQRNWELHFFRSPFSVSPSVQKGSLDVRFTVNALQGTGNTASIVPTGEYDSLQCQMVIRSAGYLGMSIDSELPFDTKLGIIKNQYGRVDGKPGVYCSGWVQSGPVGVLLTTRDASFDTAFVVEHDIEKNRVRLDENKPGFAAIAEILKKNNVQTVDFEGWNKIDRVEKERGEKVGKPREKILSVQEMLEIAKS